MIRFFQLISNKFFNKRLDFRVRLFNILAMAGTLISILMSLTSFIAGAGLISILVNLLTAAISFALLYYSYRSGKYQQCYMFTIIIIFLILFPVLFFTAGGYHSGMPSFFVFAVLFTVFMLDGRKMFIMAAIEIAVYVGICLVAYSVPQTVNFFETEQDVMIDILVGFCTVSVALGITMFLHFRLYNQQQRELEAAREEALRLSEAKSNFLANMSHEIRTPINVILGMNEMVLRESDSEQVRTYGKNIQNAGKTLLLLINNILDVSRIESGKLSVLEESYKTAELIDDLSLIGAEHVAQYGLRFQVEADETIPGALTGDSVHIKQIVSNFLSNAAKYTRQGGVTLAFAQKPGMSPGEILLRVSVADTGIGIKAEDVQMLFEAFTRADLSSNRNIEGTGLGLAIAKELAELMGGRICVESALGEGSVFSVELLQKIHDPTPLGKWAHTDSKAEEEREGSFIAPAGAVLVVDDNKENLQVARSLLARTMLRVDAVLSGAECLEAVNTARYDVILMDYMMPDIDGIETLRRLKEIPGFDTPVVALTANVVVGIKKKLLDEGFCEYLSKPVMWQDLEAVLLRLLPKEIVTASVQSARNLLSGETEDELARLLGIHGVKLGEGLRYLSGDIVQYKKLADFFIGNYASACKEIEDLAAGKDWGALKFCVHSLKGKAGAMGADGLAATAAKLESQCAAGDGAYIALMLPVLFFEWERAKDGLSTFAARIDAVLPSVEKVDVPMTGLGDLLALLKRNRQPDALDALDNLIASAGAHETASRLREIRQKVDDVEFRDAERLLAAVMGGDADER